MWVYGPRPSKLILRFLPFVAKQPVANAFNHSPQPIIARAGFIVGGQHIALDMPHHGAHGVAIGAAESDRGERMPHAIETETAPAVDMQPSQPLRELAGHVIGPGA